MECQPRSQYPENVDGNIGRDYNNLVVYRYLLGLEMGKKACKHIRTGGAVRSEGGSIIDEDTADFMSCIKYDFAALGALDQDYDGSRDHNVPRAKLKNPRTAFPACNHSKYYPNTFVPIRHASDIGRAVTDTKPRAWFIEVSKRSPTQIDIAKV